MNKIKLKIFGTIIAIIFSFLLHNLYIAFPNFITSIIAPVNESIWEHMKILFGSIILSGIIQKIITMIKKEKVNNICFSTFISAVLSIPIFLIMFLPIYYIIGENFVVSITLMILTFIIAEFISYQFTKKEEYKLENLTIFFVIVIYVFFSILTYHPLKNNIFIDPTTNTYGIPK